MAPELQKQGILIEAFPEPTWPHKPPAPYTVLKDVLPAFGHRENANCDMNIEGMLIFSNDAPSGKLLDRATLTLYVKGADRIGDTPPAELIVEALPANDATGSVLDLSDFSKVTGGHIVARIPWPTVTARGAKIMLALKDLSQVGASSNVVLRLRATPRVPGQWSITPFGIGSTLAPTLTDAQYIDDPTAIDPALMQEATSLAMQFGLSVEAVLAIMLTMQKFLQR